MLTGVEPYQTKKHTSNKSFDTLLANKTFFVCLLFPAMAFLLFVQFNKAKQ